MAEELAKLRIPYIAAAQAQKHVTHNEAMTLLDTLVQLSVLDKDLTAPPMGPAEGDCYIVAASATGAWTGWDNRVARYIDGEWRSYLPGAGSGAGWLAYVIDEAALYSFNGTSWIKSGLQLESYLDLSEISPPSNPGADVGRLYVKDVGGTTKLAFKDHAGTETVVGSGGGAIVPPQGRLTLTSAVPVLTADATAATTIYYTPYRGTSVPLYDGSAWSNNELAEISLALDSSSGHTGYHQSGKTFDLFVFDDAGTKRLGSGPAWSSDSSRGTGAGTTELTLRNGLLVNANSITARFGASSGNTVSVAANKATYVGSFRASADGQTQFKLGTISSSAAAAAINVWNAYNRRSIKTKSGTTTDTWTYNSTTPRLPNGEAIQASVLQGWLEEPVSANYHARANTTASSSSIIGIGINSTSVNSGLPVVSSYLGGATGGNAMISRHVGYLPLGWNTVSALEWCLTASTVDFFGDAGSPGNYQNALIVDWEC